MQAPRALYLPDFMTGILAALAIRRVPALSLRESMLDQAFARLNDEVLREAQKGGVEVMFRIRTHPIHRDSTQLQQALYEAAKRDLISLDNPEFQRLRLKITPEEAPAYFEGLPGTQEMYLHLADRLLAYYRDPASEAGMARQ